MVVAFCGWEACFFGAERDRLGGVEAALSGEVLDRAADIWQDTPGR